MQKIHIILILGFAVMPLFAVKNQEARNDSACSPTLMAAVSVLGLDKEEQAAENTCCQGCGGKNPCNQRFYAHLLPVTKTLPLDPYDIDYHSKIRKLGTTPF